MSTVFITGAAGFIGSELCRWLASGNEVIGIDTAVSPDEVLNITWERAELTNGDSAVAICERHYPDVVIHCAGIAHQKIGAIDSDTYMRVNSEVTESFAKAAAKSNPDVQFIFLSSVSLYGEGPRITQKEKDAPNKGAKAQKGKMNSNNGVGEDSDCWPSSDYAESKLDAERRLVALADRGVIRNLIILRLAPVYDREWSFNLDRRVFAPGKTVYLRFGTGMQKMSALARPNLVEFIVHILQSTDYLTQRRKGANFKNRKQETGDRENQKQRTEDGDDERRNLQIFNVCDAEPYEFNRIIRVFKKSGIQPNRPVISVPLSFVRFATRIAGVFFSSKREWIHSCYDKLASDLVFDNGRMMGTGFRAAHSLETIFNPQITQIDAD
jgi:nucleoside-diphosphate-sugar epimerase